MHTFQITLKMRGFRFALCASSVSHSLLNFSVSLAASFAFKFLYTSCAVNGFFNPNLKRSVKYLNSEMEEISHQIFEIWIDLEWLDWKQGNTASNAVPGPSNLLSLGFVKNISERKWNEMERVVFFCKFLAIYCVHFNIFYISSPKCACSLSSGSKTD